MNRGAWRATVHGLAELDMTERLTHTGTNTHRHTLEILPVWFQTTAK